MLLTREAGRGASAERMDDIDDQPVRGSPHGHSAWAHQECHRVEQIREVARHIQAVVERQHQLEETIKLAQIKSIVYYIKKGGLWIPTNVNR
jgi:hypothetical protein